MCRHIRSYDMNIYIYIYTHTYIYIYTYMYLSAYMHIFTFLYFICLFVELYISSYTFPKHRGVCFEVLTFRMK